MDINNTDDTVDSEDTLARILKLGYCPGGHCRGKSVAEYDHTCPYSEEINGDRISMCNCCNVCAHECAMDI